MSCLSYTTRGVLEFTRIDRIEGYNMPEYRKYPIKTDDADWATMWFIHDTPIRDCDGCDHYPIKLLVTSKIIDVKHEFTRDEMLKIWDSYVYNGRLCIHQILDAVCPDWKKHHNCIPDNILI